MIKALPLLLGFITLPALAAPQLITEIKSGDTWFKGEFSQSDSDRKYKNRATGSTSRAKSKSDSISLSSLIAIESDTDFMPLISISVENDKDKDDNESANTIEAEVGFLTHTKTGKAIALLAGYGHSDNTDESRGGFSIGGTFQTSDNTSNYHNEVAIVADMPNNEGGLKGQESLSITNTIKIPANNTVDFLLQGAAGVITNLKGTENQSEFNYDIVYVVSGGVGVNLSPKFTLNFSIIKGFISGKLDEPSRNRAFNTDIKTSSISLDLIGRF